MANALKPKARPRKLLRKGLRSFCDGRISITPLHFNLSHTAARKKLAKAFED